MAGCQSATVQKKNPLDISITEKILQSNGKPLQIVDGSATRGVILSICLLATL